MSHLIPSGVRVSGAQLMAPHVIIVGGGFGGLSAARALRRAAVRVTLIDKRNYHPFRPMLYQVATGLLSDDEIAGPLHSILSHQFVELARVRGPYVRNTSRAARRRHSRAVELPSACFQSSHARPKSPCRFASRKRVVCCVAARQCANR